MESYRALVTGAGGFVGANLCAALVSAGHETHAVLRPAGGRWRMPAIPSQAALHEVELTDYDAVRDLVNRVRPGVVFHAAAGSAYAGHPLRRIVADDVLVAAHLFDAVADVDLRRFVHLGSALEYGPCGRPHREDDPRRPTSVRGASKGAATLLALQQATAGVPIVVLRVFSVYGPWEDPRRLVPRAIRAALRGEVLPLTPPGIRRDFVFVDDVAEACLRAATAAGVVGEAINVGSGRQVANEEMVEAIGRAVGRPVRTAVGEYAPHATDRSCWVADVAKARRLLGWEPRHDLAGGLGKTVEWGREKL